MATRSTKAPYSAENVAKYLIYLASREFVGDNKEREGITNLKLQKVLYFAQAYYLAKFGKPLFAGNIEAWGLGPVVPEIYHKYKSFGSKPIINEKDESTVSENDKAIIQNVWDTFGGYSAKRLVDIAHAHTPWKDASTAPNNVISHKALKEYYGPLLNK